MAKGRTPDKNPNKVMTALKNTLNSDGSRTFTIAFNDENGNRTEGEITLAVENGVLVQRPAVTT
jgi:hypothetical protein